MKISNFVRKYNGKILEDMGSVKSQEFIQFTKDMKSTVREICKEQGAELVRWSVGHYDVSGFIKKNEKFVYFSYSESRGFPINLNASNCRDGILIRTAKSEADYTGGFNNFCNIYQMGDMINRLSNR